MPWALAMLVIVGSVTAVTVSRVRTMWQSTATDEADVQAVLSADGAVATARAALANDPAWAGGRSEIGGVTAATTVERRSDGWMVTVHAGGSVEVEARLRADGHGVPAIASWRRVR